MTLVAVSKTVATERLRAAIPAGLTTLGENRVQEAADKVPVLPGVTWHLVGPLQSNKARRAVELFDVIQSVDSVELGLRLDRLCRRGATGSTAPDPAPGERGRRSGQGRIRGGGVGAGGRPPLPAVLPWSYADS